MGRKTLFHIFSAFLAFTYFAFRVELFRSEDADNHSPLATRPSFAAASVNWESFDKDNAPKAFVIDCSVVLECLLPSVPEKIVTVSWTPPQTCIRDKSPPVPSGLPSA